MIVILLFSFGASMCYSGLFSAKNILTEDYYQTGEFENTYDNFLELLTIFELSDMDEDDIKERIVVTDREIEEHQYRYGDLPSQISSIHEQYDEKINDLENAGNKETAEVLIKERDEKIADITLNFTDREHVRKKIIAEKEKIIDQSMEQLESHRSGYNELKGLFSYYLVDQDTGEIHTTLNKSDVEAYEKFFKGNTDFFHSYMKQPLQVNMDITELNHSEFFRNYGDTVSSLGELKKVNAYKSYTGYIGVLKDASYPSSIEHYKLQYETFQKFYIAYLIIGILSLVSSIYIIYKKKLYEDMYQLQWPSFSRLPLDIRLAILVIIFLVTVVPLDRITSMYYLQYNTVSWFDFSIYVVMTTVGISTMLLQFIWLFKIWKKGELSEELHRTIILKLIRSIRDVFLVRSVGFQLVFLLAIVFFMGVGSILIFSGGEIFLLYMAFCFIIGVPILFLIVRYTSYFNKIVKTMESLAEGKYAEDLPVKGKSVFAQLARNVNTLKHGVRISKHEQVKSERLKTELITNVSHDLRTPLTSIITYTDLLKVDNLTEDERRSYIEIIDRKSKRLKVLIEDLFEASKMATGNVELNKTKVEIVQLLQQAMAEHEEKMAQTDLHFRVTHDDQPIYAVVDGQKLWRVFDNLIGNILKYAMPHSRVYINVTDQLHAVQITFKNISAFEIGDTVDELFERFKRGDKSRHTEGSGLGLAIAKSIIDLHEGEMDIDVDGDLFKVIITLNKK